MRLGRAIIAGSATSASRTPVERAAGTPHFVAHGVADEVVDVPLPRRPRHCCNTIGLRARHPGGRARHPSARKFPGSCPVLLSIGRRFLAPALLYGVCGPVIRYYQRLILVRPQLRTEPFGHRLPRPEDSRPNRAYRATHDLRDLLVRQAVELAQRDRRAQLLGQRRDRVVDRLRDLLGGELALRGVDVAQPRRRPRSPRPLRCRTRSRSARGAPGRSGSSWRC